jgi:LmbE family N-acetylglucosaminyl deacetylase
MMKVLFTGLALLLGIGLFAQKSSADIYLQLQKLKVNGSVLYIAAHPDDENNGLLPYLAKEKKYRTAYLSLTRGDGGQNLIGSEQGIDLGLIRTQELLAARRMDGSEQYFTRAYEFGFSKTADETLRFWDKQKILADVVWVIRNFRPDVIITRFPGDSRAGHGHHAASSLLANEAYAAAADTSMFPEQFKYGVTTWKAKRIVWNTYNFGSNNTTDDSQLKTNVSLYNPLLGRSYGELGAEARAMHKSQGEGRPRRRGDLVEYFLHSGGDLAKTGLMDGINTNWARFNLPDVDKNVDSIIANFDVTQPGLSVPALARLYQKLQPLAANNHWLQYKLQQVKELILDCSGIFIEAVTNTEYAVQGNNVNVAYYVTPRAQTNLQLQGLTLNDGSNKSFDTSLQKTLATNQEFRLNKALAIAYDKPLSQPYWLASAMQQATFTVTNQTLIGKAESDAAYTATFVLQIAGASIPFTVPVLYKYTDPVKGEVYQPVTVVPPVLVACKPANALLQVSGKTKQDAVWQLQYTSNINITQAPATIAVYQGTATVYIKDTVLTLVQDGVYQLSIPVKNLYQPGKGDRLTASLTLNINGTPRTFTQNMQAIQYDHIPNIHYFYTDATKLITAPVKVLGKKIGYINGAGDKIPESLQQMGYEVTWLTEQDITLANLQQFDAIVTGIRAYNLHAWLTDKNDMMNAYVQQGGNLIIQYLRSNTVGAKTVAAGPYAFTVNPAARITEEDAAVNILLPQHAALTKPNLITSEDFAGWTQERSTYQATQADARFEQPLSMKDSGDKQESTGSLLIAPYGKGNVVYASLVFFRQLPAGVAGAYKLMANLIALPRH